MSQRWADIPHTNELLSERNQLFANGFVVVEDFAPEEICRSMEDELLQLCRASSDRPVPHGIYRDPSGFVSLMNKIDKTSDYLYDFARTKRMLTTAEALLGKPAQPLHVEYFAKAPYCGHASPPHQDHAFYVDHFEDELAITFWIALDDIDESNGALQYAMPKTQALMPHISARQRDFDLELPSSAVSTAEWRTANVERGGCVIHHSFAVHKSWPNTSSRQRRAVAFNYRGSPYLAHMRASGRGT